MVQTFSDSALLVIVSLSAALIGVALLRGRDRDGSRGQTDPSVSVCSDGRYPCQYAPFPIWTATADGEVIWSNDAYQKLPPSGRFADPVFPLPSQNTDSPVRFQAELHRPGDGCPDRFQVTAIATDIGWCAFAIPESDFAGAGATSREFTQTLAKTFAQLSTGLAIFDANKRLQLFNPALVDLCGLPVDFLSTRPDLATFFDALRDRQMMPEPRNYATWRDHIADLAAAAASGRYQETWTLSSGSVYEVIGRPHPGGATAFLFQDISAEVTLTRQFRSDLDQYHAIFEALDTPLCVVSESGALAFTNRAYARFWKHDPSALLAESSVDHLCRDWCGGPADNACYALVHSRLLDGTGDPDEVIQLAPGKGRKVTCRLHPLPGGSVVVQFNEEAGAITPAQDVAQEDLEHV